MNHDFILLDRSGSMAERGLWDEALSSVNLYVKKLADDNVDTGVTLATFDTNEAGQLCFQIIRERILPKTWHPVTNEDAVPRGMTPLNDATGRIVALANAGNYDKVAIIIMTDGLENASKEVSLYQARRLLDECRAKGWQVVFLGANFDNTMQAAGYGNKASHSHTISRGNLMNASVALAGARSLYGSTGEEMSFTDEQKRELATPNE